VGTIKLYIMYQMEVFIEKIIIVDFARFKFNDNPLCAIKNDSEQRLYKCR